MSAVGWVVLALLAYLIYLGWCRWLDYKEEGQ